MVHVTKYLVEETNALVGYRQSDEITLCWYSDDIKSQVFFDGRIQKMTSILAAMATARFNRLLSEYLPDKAHLMPTFDCRVWQVPTLEEAANVFVWREQDAVRNSIQMVGQANFSHKQLQGKGCNQIQEMLFQEKGINWSNYPAWARRGTYVRKIRVTRPFSAVEIDKLPPKHEARTNPDLKVERWVWDDREMPKIVLVSNRVETLFRGADPVVIMPVGGPEALVDCAAKEALESICQGEDASVLKELEGSSSTSTE